jgi:UDP-N-acetylmuramoyl-tripeptide--D-alanyl-D-alanine ligase
MISPYQHIFDEIAGRTASIDSRLIKEGEVFFAIDNGVDFVEDAISKGAFFVVQENSLEVLLEYGKYVRSFSKAKIIGITGSVGKTTLKFWLASVLERRHKTLAGIRNYNTIYGVPVCLSMLEKDHEYGIFELGSNHPGEIREIAEYLAPDMAIITNIAPAHIGNFESIEDIAKEKMSIIDGIKNNGIVFFPSNILYKEEITCLARSKSINAVPFKAFPVQHLPRHYHDLCGCILAVIEALGLEVSEYIHLLNSELSPLPGRGQMATYSHDNKVFRIIDDSYNASITSMGAAIDSLASLDDSRNRKVAILGEMKEVGKFADEFHESLAMKAKNADIDKLVFVGSSDFFDIFRKYGFETFEKTDESAVKQILGILKDGDTVLIKGSRSIKLENIINVLQHIV